MNIRRQLIEKALSGATYKQLWETYISYIQEYPQFKPLPFEDDGAVTILDDIYPETLKQLNKPPVVLFYKGNASLLKKPVKVAVVGTRKATSYGITVAEKIGYELASSGIPVVSGLARGIDVSAHRHAYKKGVAIAVLGNGLNIYYPYENRKIQDAIAQHGLLISEYPPDMRGSKWSFVARNRIIAALSSLVVVVESPIKGGSMHTAEFAIELGIPVAAVPGDIFRKTSEGTNMLISEGALVIRKPSDVLSMLGLFAYTKTDSELIRILKKHGGYMDITELRGYYDNTGQLMKDIAYLEAKNIIKMEGSVVILID